MPATKWFRVALLGQVAVAGLLGFLTVAAFLPEIGSDRWWIRYAEFPRLQFLLATLALLALFAVLGGLRRRPGQVVAVAALVASAYQALQLLPFTPLVAAEARGVAACPAERTLSVLSANVQAGNRNAGAVLGAVRAADADVVLLFETDDWWDKQVAVLHASYPHHVASEARAARYYGMHALSRLPLTDPKMLYPFGAATPTLETLVVLRDGTPVRLVGLHPKPPLPEPQPTTLRDASIAAVASRAAASAEPVVLAGDFNAVPWSPIIGLAKRVARLEDPRIGRGFAASFDAKSAWMRWPIDLVLAQPSFAVVSFERLGPTGSDHYPILATLCLEGTPEGRVAPPVSPADRAAIERAVEAARALD